MEVTFTGDAFGRVLGTIAHDGAQATVSGSDSLSAMADLRLAVDSAIAHDHGECFWREALGEYRWLFRREGRTMRVVILRSTGTLTGWEHCLWAECDAGQFRCAMSAAMEEYESSLSTL